MMTCSLATSAQVLTGHGFAWAQEMKSAVETSVKTADARKSTDPENLSISRPATPPAAAASHEDSLGIRLLKNLAEDQRAIWTSPSRLRFTDADWILPLGLATGGMIATDSDFSKHLSNSPNRLSRSNSFSNYGLGAMAAAGGGFYFWGRMVHDDHKQEAGILAGEAALDSYGFTSAFKYSIGRERPLQDDYRGRFRQGGDSMPSEHAAAAWSIASVIAHEYPGPLTTFLAYGAATAVSLSRVTAKQHFLRMS